MRSEVFYKVRSHEGAGRWRKIKKFTTCWIQLTESPVLDQPICPGAARYSDRALVAATQRRAVSHFKAVRSI